MKHIKQYTWLSWHASESASLFWAQEKRKPEWKTEHAEKAPTEITKEYKITFQYLQLH